MKDDSTAVPAAPQAASAAGVPLRTAQRWLAAYLTQGATGLHRAGRTDKDRHRLPDELLEVIEGMALRRPPPHAAEVHRATVKIAAEQGWKPPSYTVVREVITGLDRGLLTLAPPRRVRVPGHLRVGVTPGIPASERSVAGRSHRT